MNRFFNFLYLCFLAPQFLQCEDPLSSFFSKTNQELLCQIYGSNQEGYREASFAIIVELVDKMRSAKQEGRTDSFLSDILPWLAKKRGELAKELRSDNSFLFGVSRDRAFYRLGINITPLSGPFYQAAGKKFIDSLLFFIRKNDSQFSQYGESILRLVPGCFYSERTQSLERVSEFQLSMYGSEDVLLMSQELETRFDQMNPFSTNILLGGDEENAMFRAMENIEWTDVLCGIQFLKNGILQDKTENILYLVGTSFLEIQEILEPLSKLLLPVEIDRETKTLLTVYPPLVIHQRTCSTANMLRDLDKIGAEIFRSLGTASIEEQIDLIGLLCYEYAHANPFVRGSAAIGEWIEIAFYRFLGLSDFCQTSETTIDLEVFSSLTLQEFITKYRNIMRNRI